MSENSKKPSFKEPTVPNDLQCLNCLGLTRKLDTEECYYCGLVKDRTVRPEFNLNDELRSRISELGGLVNLVNPHGSKMQAICICVKGIFSFLIFAYYQKLGDNRPDSRVVWSESVSTPIGRDITYRFLPIKKIIIDDKWVVIYSEDSEGLGQYKWLGVHNENI